MLKKENRYSSKKLKIGLIPMKLQGVVVLWPIAAEESWCSAFLISVREKS